jgi:hypothetical protein
MMATIKAKPGRSRRLTPLGAAAADDLTAAAAAAVIFRLN